MSIPMLVVDRDLGVVRRESAGWGKRGIPTVRVDTMCEALREVSRDTYLFIAINADSVNYLPMLDVLCEVSPIPVFIITSKFTLYAQVEALHHGADAYVPFQESVDENIMLALALINHYNEKNKSQYKKPKFIPYDKIFVFPQRRQVFCGDEEIHLTKKELNILLYLLANRGIVLTYRQIYYRVWGRDYQDVEHNALWTIIGKLRKKLEQAAGNSGYIVNVKDVGYKLPPYNGA